MASKDYDFKTIENKWQKRWLAEKTFKAEDFHKTKDKFYCLMMYPYPSGTLHVGHGRNYIIGDAVTRFLMMQGKNVLTPMGWDSFGLPAENYAIKVGQHPKKTTEENIAKMKKQFLQWGVMYDWDREVTTSSPEYYKWTQWLFQKMYDNGLAYRKNAPVNWCESCVTVLANEQVVEGKCERCGSVVYQKDMSQWFYKITEYAQEMLDELENIDWPERVKLMQKHWIGRSEGCYIDFPLEGNIQANKNIIPETDDFPVHGVRKEKESEQVLLRVFTTRPDTVYGVTFMALAPEHPIVEELLNSKENVLSADEKAKVRDFIKDVRQQSAFERESDSGEKKGMFLGRYVSNPLYPDDKKFDIPLYVGNYVLMYGTGIVMAVPAHDQRDFEFAKKQSLKFIKVIEPDKKQLKKKDFITQFYGGPNDNKEKFAKEVLKTGFPENVEDWKAAWTGEGISCNSVDENHNDLKTPRMKDAVAEKLGKINRGGKTINYRLRDWLISRQRMWGCPIPMVYCEECGWQKVPEKDLPVMLPTDIEFKGLKGNPLEASESFKQVKCPKCGKSASRETDTMDTFVDSSWYFLRYLDAKNENKIFDKEKIEYWMPVDQYIGGIEHATGHLIFARFFTKVFADLGLIDFREPFKKLFTQGMIGKEAFYSETQGFLMASEVEGVDEFGKYQDKDKLACKKDGSKVDVTMEKMSKSKYNVVDPKYLIEKYGADTERLYTLFIGPPTKGAEWQDDAVIGSYRFLQRLWEQADTLKKLVKNNKITDANENLGEKFKKLRNTTHFSIKKVTRDMGEGFQFNTAIAQIMTLSNTIRECLRDFDAETSTQADEFALKEAIISAVKLIAPFVPHFAEEVWENFGNTESIFKQKYPVAIDKWLAVDEIQMPIQINGKIRHKMMVAPDLDDKELEKLALAEDKVQKNIDGLKIRKVIIVKNRIINIIAN